jgi:hypothetical protein
MTNTKLLIAAAAAALSLATTAFAAEGNGDPFPFRAPASPVAVTTARDTGAAQYPAYNPRLSWSESSQLTLPENGSNGPVETANSLPRGAMDGTAAFMQAQSVNRWFAMQADHRFAQASQRRQVN